MMIRRAIRSLLRNPAAPLVAIVTLALGLAISTALFTVARDVVMRPFPIRDQDRVAAVWSHVPERGVPHLELTMAEYELIRAQAKTLEDAATMSAANFNVILNIPEPVQVRANFVSRSFYKLLGAQAQRGRLFAEAEHAPNAPHVILLSHRAWTTLFAGRDMIGKPVDVEGDKFTVVGILPADLNVPAGSDVIFAMEPNFGAGENDKHNSVLEGIARLKPNVTLASAEAEINAICGRLESVNKDAYAGVRKKMIPFVNEILGATRPAMLTLFAMSLLVLAIATFNVANIFVARAVTRQRDLAIRAALGASRGALLRETLAETLVVAVAAAAVGFVLAQGAVTLLKRVAPETVPRIEQVHVDLTTYLFAAAASLLVAVLCAVVASLRRGGWASLREDINSAHAAQRSRRLLAVLAGVQLAVALVLMVAAALMIRSFISVASIDAGFERERVLTAQLPLPGAAYPDANVRRRFFTNVLERLRTAPGITAAGATLIRPLELEVGWDWTYTAEGQTPDAQQKNPLANLVSITPGYIEAMGIPMLRGRTFNARDTENAPKAMIVGRAFALRHWGTLDVVGKRVKAGKFDSDKPWRTIVGVANDVRYRGLMIDKLDVYHPYEQSPWTPQYVAVRTSGSPHAAEATLRSVVRSIDPRVPVSAVQSTEDLVEAKIAQPRLNAWILGVFAAVSMLLSIIGVYAVLNYAIRNRTGEMGVRLALGARGNDLLRLVLREAVFVALGACIAGGIAALFLTRMLSGFLYGVARLEPLTLLIVAAAIVAAAMAGSLVPALRASRVDPVVALRDGTSWR
jgi:putative ABC transport system permease protein